MKLMLLLITIFVLNGCQQSEYEKLKEKKELLREKEMAQLRIEYEDIIESEEDAESHLTELKDFELKIKITEEMASKFQKFVNKAIKSEYKDNARDKFFHWTRLRDEYIVQKRYFEVKAVEENADLVIIKNSDYKVKMNACDQVISHYKRFVTSYGANYSPLLYLAQTSLESWKAKRTIFFNDYENLNLVLERAMLEEAKRRCLKLYWCHRIDGDPKVDEVHTKTIGAIIEKKYIYDILVRSLFKTSYRYNITIIGSIDSRSGAVSLRRI